MALTFAPADHLAGWFVDEAGPADAGDDLLDIDAPYDPDDLDRAPVLTDRRRGVGAP